jgi:hypothetical protein
MKSRKDLPRMQLQSLEIGGFASHCGGFEFLEFARGEGSENELEMGMAMGRDSGRGRELLLKCAAVVQAGRSWVLFGMVRSTVG